MNEDPIRKYSDAMGELSKALEQVQKIRGIIARVGSNLLNPYQFMVSDVNVGFPAEVAMGRVPTLSAREWPNAQQIAEVLSTLHKKRHEVNNLWRSLSENDKSLVSPPPEKK